MTAFSDFPPPADHPLHPDATQIRAYLHDYAARSVYATDPARVARADVRPGWTVDGEPFDAVVVASGRFGRPQLPPGLDRFGGEVLHAFDYPGAEPFRDRPPRLRERHQRDRDRVGPCPGRAGRLGVPQAAVRDPEGRRRRLVGLAVVHALRRARAPPAPARRLDAGSGNGCCALPGRRRTSAPPRRTRTSSSPGSRSVRTTSRRSATAASSAGRRSRRSTVARSRSRTGRARRSRRWSARRATPWTSRTSTRVRELLGPDLALVHRTLHPDLPGLGVVGQFLAQGPYFPLLELQARWIVGVWAGDIVPPEDAAMRRALAASAPALETHNALAATLAEQAGVAPDPGAARPRRAAPLRADASAAVPPRRAGRAPGGRGPLPRGSSRPRLDPPVDPAQVDELRAFGLGAVAETLEAAGPARR